MNLVLAAGVVIGAVTIAVAIMLLVRRRAPAGSHFNDGDRAAGVFGVLATGFSVLLGFIIFLAFSAYDDSRAGAEDEATTVAQMVQTAQFLPPDVSAQLTGQLICYGRSVAGTMTGMGRSAASRFLSSRKPQPSITGMVRSRTIEYERTPRKAKETTRTTPATGSGSGSSPAGAGLAAG